MGLKFDWGVMEASARCHLRRSFQEFLQFGALTMTVWLSVVVMMVMMVMVMMVVVVVVVITMIAMLG